MVMLAATDTPMWVAAAEEEVHQQPVKTVAHQVGGMEALVNCFLTLPIMEPADILVVAVVGQVMEMVLPVVAVEALVAVAMEQPIQVVALEAELQLQVRVVLVVLVLF